MKLSNFEQFFEMEILKRGENYFLNGHVEKIEEVKENHFLIDIFGSDFYTVDVILADNEIIVDTACDCPYDWSEFCKHQAAALYALRKEVELMSPPKKVAVKDKAADLKSILSKLKKEELVNIILDFSQEHQAIKTSLLLKYGQAEDNISASKKLIKEFMQKAKRHGFIEWNRVDDALEGAYIVLEKAQIKVNEKEYDDAVLLCLAVLSAVVDMIAYCDDSNGSVGDVIDESLAIIERGASISAFEFSNNHNEKIFAAILKEACNKRYDGWSDWRNSLLESCIYFTDDKKRRKKLEDILAKMLKGDAEDLWSTKYNEEQIKLLQLKIIELYESADELESFLWKNMQYSSFREKVINMQLEKSNYAEVIALCNQGEEGDKEYAGLVTKWKKYRLKAYAGLQDKRKQCELLLELLLNGHFECYLPLKELYTADQWPAILQEILDKMKQQRYLPSAYLQILIEEKLKDKILEYCEREPAFIKELYPYLMEDYAAETSRVFAIFIHNKAAAASNRKQYKQVCKEMKAYKKVCGDLHTKKVIDELLGMYANKPAFVDELGKIR